MSPRQSKSPQVKKVVSASRRTELVAHYPDYLVERLTALNPESIHTVVLWTKDPSNLLAHQKLRATLSRVGQVFVHWTVTGLGGTFLEPSVPPMQEQLLLLDAVIEYVGDPRRVHWRFDPLLSARRGEERLSNVDLNLFRPLAERFSIAGIPTVHVSFVSMYRKVVRRLAAVGVTFEEYDCEMRRQFLSDCAEVASGYGMAIATCCEPGFPVQRCIDGALLTDLHPTNEPCRTERASGQRKLCGCTVSLDVGRYLPCPNRCLYCYAHPAT